VNPAMLAHQDAQVPMHHPANRDQKDRPAHPANQDHQDRPATPELQLRANQFNREHQANQETQDHQAHRAHLAIPVKTVLRVHRDRKAHLVPTEAPAAMVNLAHQAIQASRALKANGVSVRSIAPSTAASSSKTAPDDKRSTSYSTTAAIIAIIAVSTFPPSQHRRL